MRFSRLGKSPIFTFFPVPGNKAHLLFASLLLPALLINLGMLPLIGDEAIRAVVALEMMISGDYITPTLTGENYLNKPPLFNWILTAFIHISGRNDEMIIRLPTTLFLLGYGFTIYAWVRKYIHKEQGIFAALFFITCGRILFWDSFLGLIDILYSWIIFMNFMVIWHYSRNGSWYKLFLISYLLAAAGFLLKGLPTLVFQGISLITLFVLEKRYRILFSRSHFLGLFVFVFVTGIYYVIYEIRNPGYLNDALLRLITESTQKSALGSGLASTVVHFFTFPLEVIYHFVPWTLLAVLLFHRPVYLRVYQQPFIRYCIWIFLLNISVYWLSPVTYPRYLLMLIPLLFIVLLYISEYHALLHTFNYRIVRIIIPVFAILLIIANTGLPLLFYKVIPVENLFGKVLLVLILNILAIGLLYRFRHFNVLYFLILVMVISRISFNLFLIPYRLSESWMALCRQDAVKMGQGTKGKPLYFMTDTITMHNVYYLTREREQILKYKSTPEAGAYFIVADTTITGSEFKKTYSMRIPYYKKTYYGGMFIDHAP